MLREHLGFSLDEVAHVAELSRDELKRIETLEDPTSIDADIAGRFEDLYGVDIERWLELPAGALEGALPPVATLLRAQAEVLGSVSRFAIAESMTVARRARELQRELGLPDRWSDTARRFRDDADDSGPAVGERLANVVRERLLLGGGPIPSMSKLVENAGVLVLWEDLPPHIDALALAGDEVGGVIVANALGPRMANAFLRRVTLAHELCHLLFDRSRMRHVDHFCDPKRSRRGPDVEPIEARARAFTMYFLAPREAAIAAWTEAPPSEEKRVRYVMERFGTGYEATRHHLHFLGILHRHDEIEQVEPEPPLDWDRADPGAPTHLERKALDAGVSKVRAGAFFAVVWRAYRDGVFSDSAARDELRITAAQWQQLKLSFAGRKGEWSTSSAIHD